MRPTIKRFYDGVFYSDSFWVKVLTSFLYAPQKSGDDCSRRFGLYDFCGHAHIEGQAVVYKQDDF